MKDSEVKEFMSEIRKRLLDFHCPRWEEMPDVELYADQVVNYIERHLSALDVEGEGHLLTASMINNYVKMRLIPAPVKKRYGVRQLARLVVICTLKRDFSIAELSSMMQTVLAKYENVEAYNRFCAEMETTIRSVFCHEEIPAAGACMEDQIIRAVMMAFANKLLAHCTIREYTMAAPGDGDVSAEQA